MSKRTVVIAGITLNVFSLDNRDSEPESTSPKPIAILFLLHGRTSRADHLELMVKAFLDEVSTRRRDPAQAGKEAHDLWVVTFDHRNHGSRLVDSLANQAWDKDPNKSNTRHA
ncbi:hypothetical protein GSI_05418 [Ganoderma sinense ZZ0214-1]|uniref:Uncharacterized protein n=1 Tax=Ganoderma sinense ZZ0214-1 TaxID=1077348 RepID=A0A2G8SEJ8_9APHY|nr:hypothetical protein GSI_05418 [Ganoderma sinense ZZ0214-1]